MARDTQAPRGAAREARRGRADTALALACATLLGLTLLSAHAVCGTYARFVTAGASADAAHVARFGTVTVTGGSVVNITGSSAMGTVEAAQVADADLGPAATYAEVAEPVKVQMTTTEVAAKVLLTVKADGWSCGRNAEGRTVVYYGSGPDAPTVWFELADGWEYLDANSSDGTYAFCRTVEAGTALDVSVMRHDRLYSSLTVESRAELATASAPSLAFSAQAIQID